MSFLLLMSVLSFTALLAPAAFARVPDQDRPDRISAMVLRDLEHARLPAAGPESLSKTLGRVGRGREAVRVTEFEWLIIASVLLIGIIVLVIAL
jgi:hypothetical protein